MKTYREMMMERDDRELKLPGWVRARLHDLRLLVEELHNERTALLARAGVGVPDSDTEALLDAGLYGLGSGTVVRFTPPGGVAVDVSVDRRGVVAEAVRSHDLVIVPVDHTAARLRAEPPPATSDGWTT